jgi:hypothetical protein
MNNRIARAAHAVVSQGEVEMRHLESRIDFERLLELRDRLLGLPRIAQDDPDAVVRFGVARVQFQRGAEMLKGLPELIASQQRPALLPMRFRRGGRLRARDGCQGQKHDCELKDPIRHSLGGFNHLVA